MSGARILVVDDEPEITRALRTILSGHGFEPILAASAREGLDLLMQRQKLATGRYAGPDYVTLD